MLNSILLIEDRLEMSWKNLHCLMDISLDAQACYEKGYMVLFQ